MRKQLESIQKLDFWKGKKIIITGGTSGLGRALTELLYHQGAHVAIIARTATDLNEIEVDLTSTKSEGSIITIREDISDKHAIHKIFNQAIGQLGGIDVLINNASTLGPTPLKLLLDTTCEELEEVLQTNLLGPFRLAKTVIPPMIIHSGGGIIVNISSDAAKSSYPTWGSYSISKAALDHLSRVWSAELSKMNIQVLALNPGDMATPMHFAAIPDADRSSLSEPEDVAFMMLKFLQRDQFLHVRYSADEWREAIS